MYRYDRRTAAPRKTLDPSKPLDGNAVVYFDIDGDPESLDLRKGEVPMQVVEHYLRKRVTDGQAKPGHHPDELQVNYKRYDGAPDTFTTKVRVEARR